MRLDRLLRTLGLGTRGQAKDILRAGRLTVDGVPVRDPAQTIDPEHAALALDGQPIAYQSVHCLMFHKPSGVLTAAADARAPTVMDLLPPLYRASGVMPVGRLDKDTTGFLLLTNDGALAHRLLDPKRHVDKVYEVTLDASPTPEDAAAFAAGLRLSDFQALPAELDLSGDRPRVTVREGKFHQVKRMFAARGIHVEALHRRSIGPISLDPALAPGAFRPLTLEEETDLRRACGA
jgi:16S rRNA pseudouridine516 synthase